MSTNAEVFTSDDLVVLGVLETGEDVYRRAASELAAGSMKAARALHASPLLLITACFLRSNWCRYNTSKGCIVGVYGIPKVWITALVPHYCRSYRKLRLIG